jgi:hypothetical protein
MNASKMPVKKKSKDLLEEFELEELGQPNTIDITASGLKSFLGPIPVFGPLFLEIISTAIPNQRLDRLASYAKTLAEFLNDLQEEFIKSRFTQPGVLDIFSEGARQAANAYTEEKIAYIAKFVEKSITAEEVDILKTMSLASILEKVNHVEIIILRHCALKGNSSKELEEKFPDIFLSAKPLANWEIKDFDTIEQRGFIQNSCMNLDGLGLIYVSRHNNKGSLGDNELTITGAMLLRQLGYNAESSYTYQELIAKEEKAVNSDRLSTESYRY